MTVTRQELYELVWSTPMIHVAAKFGVSGSYLARVCTLLRVPRPERGYWARLAVGRAQPVVPLPEAEPGHPVEWSKETGFDVLEKQQPRPRERRKALPTRRTAVAIAGTHFLIAGARKHFENSRPSEKDDDYLRPFKKILVDITVSRPALTQALTLADSLFNALESVGYRVVVAHEKEHFRRDTVEEREIPSKRPGRYYPTPWKPRDPTVVYAENASIGLALVEMSEEVLMRYVGGKYIRDSEYTQPKRSRHLADYSWTTTQDLPTGRFRLVAYSPYQLVSWSTHWQETKASSLLKQIPCIVREIKKIALDLAQRLADAEVIHARERQAWLEEEERRRRADDRAHVRASQKQSQQQLELVIEAWARAMNLERFLCGVEERAAGLSAEVRNIVLSRLTLAREVIGSQDPLEHFLAWQTPGELYEPRYQHEGDSDPDDAEE